MKKNLLVLIVFFLLQSALPTLQNFSTAQTRVTTYEHTVLDVNSTDVVKEIGEKNVDIIFNVASSIIQGSNKDIDAFDLTNAFKQSIETTPIPIFSDSFENTVNTPSHLTNKFYNQTIPSTNDISFLPNGKEGSCVHLNSLRSYIGYYSQYINPNEGTIKFYYKPDDNLYDIYCHRQPEWTDYGPYKPPYSGFLIDTVSYLNAYNGSFFSELSFAKEDPSNKNITLVFGAFSNPSGWSYATYPNLVLSPNRWYDIAYTWSTSEGKIKVYVDGVLKASSNLVAPFDNHYTFFIGENPFKNYLAYGPHSLMGSYDELRVYNTKLTISTFTITAKAGIGGSISPSGTVTVDSGESKTFTITPNTGYKIKDVKVDGVSKGAVSSYTFTNVISNHTIEAIFEEEKETEDKPFSEVLTIVLQIDKPYMTVNGVKKEIDPGRGSVPVIVKGRTLVPIRAIIEAMGGEIFWDAKERKVTIKLRATTIELWIDKKTAKVNGNSKTLDVPPTILNGRTMVPLRFVTEELGYEVLWDGTTRTVTIKYGKGVVSSEINKISSQGEKVIGPQGGELTLSDGTTLTIPKNSLKEDSKIKLTSIINPNFSSVDTLGFEILGLSKLSGEITLKFTAKKGLNNDEYDVYGYIEEKDERFEVASNYDPNSGLVNVKIKNQTQNIIYPFHVLSFKNTHQSMGDKIWIYFGWSEEYTPKSKEKIMKIPYYEQVGGSCVSTSTQMLLKAHGINYANLPYILSKINANDKDFGLGANTIAGVLRDFISSQTGYPVVHIPNWSTAHLKWRILQELDKGHPVILSYPCKYPDSCKSSHAVLIIGYRNNGSELVIHDPGNMSPKDANDGTMYTIRDWKWIETRRTIKLHRYQILYIDGAFTTQNFITLTLPSNDETGAMCNGDLSFKFFNTTNNKYVTLSSLQIKPSIKPDGLVWVKNLEKIDAIPQEADILNVRLFAYNSVFEPKNVELITSIVHNDGTLAGGKVISQNKKQLNLPSATFDHNSRGEYKYTYKLEDIRNLNLSDKDGYLNIYIKAALFDGTTVKDSFVVKAKIDVKPKVTSISPETGSEGDKITINGYAFGKEKSKNSKVTINNLDAEILSWSDKKIEIKLPKGVTSGPVVVYNGENFEYKSNDNVHFNSKNLKQDCEGFIYRIDSNKIPNYYDCASKEWREQSLPFYLFILLKDGKVIYMPSLYNRSHPEVSGSYDNNGNITFTLKYDGDLCSDHSECGYILTGTFTGKIYKDKNGVCRITGTFKGKARSYDKNPTLCDPYDATIDFISSMDGSEYKKYNEP